MMKAKQEDTGDFIRVRYDHHETGWVVRLGHDLARIENIPLTPRCNLGDIVRLEASDAEGLPWVGAVLHRRYTAKTILYYYGLQELQTLCGLLKLLGCETEGARHPEDLTPGALLVAHDRQIRPDLLAVAAGIPQPVGVPTRVALPGGYLVVDTSELRLETPEGSEVARWLQGDWTENPEVAVRALDTLHRLVCRGVAASQPGLPGGTSLPLARRRSDRASLDTCPTTVRFRRRHHFN